MEQLHTYETSRRKFITSIVPICAAVCFVRGRSVAFTQTTDKTSKQTRHKFDQKLDQEFT